MVKFRFQYYKGILIGKTVYTNIVVLSRTRLLQPWNFKFGEICAQSSEGRCFF